MTNDKAKATEQLRQRICSSSDGDLLRMVYFDHDQYREEALDYARAEINRRNLSLVRLSARKLNQDTKTAIRWQTKGLILSIIFWVCILILGAMTANPKDKIGFTLFVLGLATTFYYRHYAANRRRRKFLESLEMLDDRLDESPVLYLRSFSDDEGTRLIGKTTEFEQLAMIFDPVGPIITIGDPHEKLPKEVGAIPIYVSNAHWEQSVIGHMANAELVILRIGVSPSLLWELKTAIKGVEPERLILLVPRDKKVYEAFRERTKEMFQYPLPECDIKMIDSRLIERVLRLAQFPFSLIGLNRSLSLHGLIHFEPDGTPRYAKFGIDLFRSSIEAPEVPKILRALRPAFDQLGIDWKLPRVRLINIFLVCYVFLQFVGFLVVIISNLSKLLPKPGVSVFD